MIQNRCPGSRTQPIRVHPETGAGECSRCGMRFDANQMVPELPDHKRFDLLRVVWIRPDGKTIASV